MRRFLAIDIGTSAGRHVAGWTDNNQIKTEEVYRFENAPEEKDGHLVWNLERLFREVETGIREALARYGSLDGISVDSWGADYVLMEEDREILPCYASADKRTERISALADALVSPTEVYAHTGFKGTVQGTLYQLVADQLSGRLEKATDQLMISEYLAYKLTGRKVKEYTISATSGLVSAETGEYDKELLAKLNLPERLFPELKKAGYTVGRYKGIRVCLCGSHNAATAVEGIPAKGEGLFLFLGEQGLMGARTAKPVIGEAAAACINVAGSNGNYLMRGGLGLSIIRNLMEDLCPNIRMADVILSCEDNDFNEVVDLTEAVFHRVNRKKYAFDSVLNRKPCCTADYLRCAYRSLALFYRNAFLDLEQAAGQTFERIYLLGEEAANRFLCYILEEACGKQVIPVVGDPIAIGNLRGQTGWHLDRPERNDRPERPEKKRDRFERQERRERPEKQEQKNGEERENRETPEKQGTKKHRSRRRGNHGEQHRDEPSQGGQA